MQKDWTRQPDREFCEEKGWSQGRCQAAARKQDIYRK